MDGWHKIYGLDVRVEDGIVKCGVRYDGTGGAVPIYPYRRAISGGWWDRDDTLTLDACRAGMKRETIQFF